MRISRVEGSSARGCMQRSAGGLSQMRLNRICFGSGSSRRIGLRRVFDGCCRVFLLEMEIDNRLC